MMPFIDIVTVTNDNSGSVSFDGERLRGMTIHEVRLLGLKIITVTKAAFVKEMRLFGCLIMRRRLKGWGLYRSVTTP